ncbi:MAG: alpha/beta fold hydrolase [Microbacteriaceae bacterium]
MPATAEPEPPEPEPVEPEVHGFTDAEGVRISYYRWPAARPRGLVQIAHGVGEHARRYDHVAAALTAAGYSVYADDHRGHGRTGLEQWGGDTSRLGRLGPGGVRAAIAAVRRFTAVVRADAPDLPLAFVGHSWGSLMGQKILDAHPGDWDAVVFSGSAYRMPGSMNAGDLGARHRALGTTGAEWLSRDPAVAQAFVDDPLTTLTPLMRLFGLADALRMIGRPPRRLPGVPERADPPLLLLVGDDDPLGGERSIQRLAAAYLSAGLTDVTAIVYPGARHEVFNELNRDRVLADLVAWLDERLAAPDRTRS